MAALDQTLKYTITADASKAKAEVASFDKALHKLGGSGGASQLQKGFKDAASEASNLVSIFTGNKLTGITSQLTSFGGALGAIPGPAGLAAGAVLGVAAAGAAAVAALYGATKAASDFGSTIHDAAIKTGLGAETISALKLAADQSGSSLDQVTGGIAKFAKTVGAAADGSKEAAKKLSSLGIDPKKALDDLDGSLAKVFKRIGEAKPGIEQITLAQKAFGKSGADLIPLMEQVGFNLEEFKRRAKELGLTITDEAANAADAFGDQMVILTSQLKMVEVQIGQALMPTFMGMATEMSDWLVKNKSEVEWWAGAVNAAFKGVIWQWRMYAWAIRQAEIAYLKFKGIPIEFEAAPTLDVSTSTSDHTAGMGGGPKATRGGSDEDAGGGSGKIHKAPKETDEQFRKFFEEMGWSVGRTTGKAINKNSPHTYGGAADLPTGGSSIEHPGRGGGKSIEQIFQLIAKSLEKGYRVVDESGYYPARGIKRTGPNVHVENAKTSLTKSSIFSNERFSAEQLAYLQMLDKERLGKASGTKGLDDFTKKQNDEQLKNYTAFVNQELAIGKSATEQLIALKERERKTLDNESQYEAEIAIVKEVAQEKRNALDDELASLELLAAAQTDANERLKIRREIDLKTIENQTTKIRLDGEEADAVADLDDKLATQNRLMREAADARDKNYQDHLPGIIGVTPPGYDELGNEITKIPDKIDPVKDALHELGAIGKEAFGQMAQGMGSMVEQWVLYGNAGPNAMRKMTASILAGVASQAAVKAIFELAEGFAALANPFLAWTAPLHFKAAAIYGGVAVGAAVAGRAVAGNSFNEGSGSASSSGGTAPGSTGSAYSAGTSSPSPQSQTYSRSTSSPYNSGRDVVVDRLNATVEMLRQQIVAVPPGHVFMKGMAANRGEVGRQAVRDVADNHAIGRDLIRTIGVKG